MNNQSQLRTTVCIVIASAALALGACRGGDNANSNSAAAAPSPAASPTATSSGGITSMFRREGPAVLSTVGLYDGEPTREVKAAEGTFTIQNVDDVDTLMVGGKPTFYQQTEIVTRPEPIVANNSLTLVGVFELPNTSVAWAIIGGGSACAATHVLVPVRDGVVLPGQSIPGCDDRGTMRRAGDRIVFEAGGSTGSFQNDMLTVELSPDLM